MSEPSAQERIDAAIPMLAAIREAHPELTESITTVMEELLPGSGSVETPG